jgi:hypothetical protein
VRCVVCRSPGRGKMGKVLCRSVPLTDKALARIALPFLVFPARLFPGHAVVCLLPVNVWVFLGIASFGGILSRYCRSGYLSSVYPENGWRARVLLSARTGARIGKAGNGCGVIREKTNRSEGYYYRIRILRLPTPCWVRERRSARP